MKIIRILMAVSIIAGCVVMAFYMGIRSDRTVRELAISVLRDVPRSFHVMESSEQLTVATINSGGWLLGPRIGQVVAQRTTYWGIDLTVVQPGDIVVGGNQIRVRLPAPDVLDVAVDLSSLHFFTKRSGLQLLGDLATGRSLEHDLMTLVYCGQPEPTTDEIESRRREFVARLNRDVAELFREHNLVVEFY